MTTNRHGKGQGLNRPELDRVVCSLAAMVREARFTGYSPPDIGRDCPFCGGRRCQVVRTIRGIIGRG